MRLSFPFPLLLRLIPFKGRQYNSRAAHHECPWSNYHTISVSSSLRLPVYLSRLVDLRQTVQAAATSTSLTTSPASAATQTTSSTTTKATTTPDSQQGPVGQPAETPETPGGPTPFTYTTTDANGNYVATTGVFIPSFAATTPFTPTVTGTILPYSVWLSMVRATATSSQAAAAQKANAASWVGVNLSLLLGAISMAIIGFIGRLHSIPL